MGGKKKENVAPANSSYSTSGSLAAAFNRRKTMLIKEASDVEEDCGFKFQRKQPPVSPSLKKATTSAKGSKPSSNKKAANVDEEKKKLRNRRKSLIASSAVANARRKSSISIPLSQGNLQLDLFDAC